MQTAQHMDYQSSSVELENNGTHSQQRIPEFTNDSNNSSDIPEDDANRIRISSQTTTTTAAHHNGAPHLVKSDRSEQSMPVNPSAMTNLNFDELIATDQYFIEIGPGTLTKQMGIKGGGRAIFEQSHQTPGDEMASTAHPATQYAAPTTTSTFNSQPQPSNVFSLEPQTDHQPTGIVSMDFVDPSRDLVDLSNQFLLANEDGTIMDNGHNDCNNGTGNSNNTFVYVMDMNVMDDGTAYRVGNGDLPAILLSTPPKAVSLSTTTVDDQQQTNPPILIAVQDANDGGNNETADTRIQTYDDVGAMIMLEDSISYNDTSPSDANNAQMNADDDDEPYALRDTVEVRLYNEMSKRSLIQLLVAANTRIADLEQRLASIESAHAKVLGSLDVFRSVLKKK